MSIIADLHLHGRFAQACSNKLSIKSTAKYARMKGIDLLGTGDFTHPKWFKEIKEDLTEDEDTGIYRTSTEFPYMLTTEISFIYKQDGRGRRIHNLVWAPSISAVEQIRTELLKEGRLDYDGRPIFGMTCPDFVERMKDIDERIEIIPAHIWTPWYSLFGSKSGFDHIENCFQDMTKHINAVETGLSSDPPMNWRLSQLDDFNLVSFSDSHSYWPWRLGREATMFDTDFTYDSIVKAVRTRKGLSSTIEVDPNYGKYHFDGHRKCDVCMHPEETQQHDGTCPKCKTPLTRGVLYRVEELADRPEGYIPDNPQHYLTLLPLHELISKIVDCGVATKTVGRIYDNLTANATEFEVLLNMSEEQLRQRASGEIVDAILLNRKGEIGVTPGYDGVYGELELQPQKQEQQTTL